MTDLISRQAAIDAFLTELTKREQTNLLHTWSTVEVKYFITDMMEQLPSAQPEPPTHGSISAKTAQKQGNRTTVEHTVRGVEHE